MSPSESRTVLTQQGHSTDPDPKIQPVSQQASERESDSPNAAHKLNNDSHIPTFRGSTQPLEAGAKEPKARVGRAL